MLFVFIFVGTKYSVASITLFMFLLLCYSSILKCTWILTGIVLVIEHLKYSKTLCVAENSIVLAKPEMLTLFQLGAGHGGETHSITILLLTYLLP